MMGMNTALAQCSSATLANSASKANDRLRTSTGMWSMRGAGAGGEAVGSVPVMASRGASSAAACAASALQGVSSECGARAAPGSEGSVGEGCGAVTGAFMRGLWGSPSPLYVGGRLRRNLAAKAFSRAFYSG